MRQGKLCRQGTMLIDRRLLLMAFSCGAVMSASVPAHKSTGSVTQENVLEVPLGQSAELSCHLPPGVLEDSCIHVQTKATREKNRQSMFITGPEVEVEETEKVLLYLRKGQKTEHQSPLYRNRTHYLGGADVRVKLLNVSVSDNNTIFQCVVCPHCGNCVLQREFTLRTEKRTDDGGGNGNSTVPGTAPVLVVVVGIVVVVCLFCVRKKRANQSTQDATEGGTMGAVENGELDRPTEIEGNQPDGSLVMTQNQPDGSLVMTQNQPNGSVMMTPDQLNGSAIIDQDQAHGPTMKNQQQQQHQQSGSAESTAAPEQEPLLRNGHSRGEDGRGGQSDQDRALSEQETCL
ncbi:uncharacterized protein LOC143100071 isoform X2 [Alosa pseudoharengus]|uniref:uncharacterized protein LOC143100071 isoform X2 n=1 Tax=Alosa pseudoharengus TaxID=34774 RepID=UPI003F8C875D